MSATDPTPRQLADMVLMDEFRDQYLAMLNVIADDQASLADANWSTLTAAGKLEALRAVDQHLLVGMRRVLRALGVPVRYARGDG